MKRLPIILIILCAVLCGCQTARPVSTQLGAADIDLLVVHAETTLGVAESSFDAFVRVAEASGMPAAEVAMRKARFENRIALLRSHLEWLKGKVVEGETE